MNPSNCNSRTPLILGLTLKVKFPYVSFESVLSMNPTSGLKFGPIFLRSMIPSSQFDRYDSEAPTSLAPLGSPGDRVVCIGIGTTGPSVHLHNAQLRATKRPRQPGSAIDGHLLSGYWINSNLTAKEQLILIADIEIEYPCVFEEELALLRNEDFERRQIERLKVDLGIGKIRVSCQIQDEV